MSKRLKHIFLPITVVMGMGWFTPLWATEAQMKETLVQIIHQLQAIKPLINQAERQAPTNPRVQMHFNRWRDVHGSHPGLRQDIEAIQRALIEAVNRGDIEPRVFTPLAHDFVEKH